MKISEYIIRSISSFRNMQLLVIMMACSIVLTATMICFLAYSHVSFNHDSRERLTALCDIIGGDISNSVIDGDILAISKSLAMLRADPSIKQLFVLNTKEQVIGYYQKEIGVFPVDLQQNLNLLRSEIQLLYFELSPGVERPIFLDGSRIGTILIEQDKNIIVRKIIATACICVFILLFALGLSYLLARRFQKIITDPLTSMVTTMQDVSRTKDYSKRVHVSNTAEINTLVNSFNEMLTEIEIRDEELLELANFDILTGLPNRSLFSDRLDQSLLRAAKAGERIAVLFIDLDDFKMINDTHGHQTGDVILRETAGRLAVGTRADDTLARLGGDEFTIFLQDIKSVENALAVAHAHIESLFRPYQIDDKQLFISASIGLALYPEHGATAETLIKNADAAMYQAKEKGKNNTEIFSESLHLRISERWGLSNDLHRALEQHEFEIYYQPRINLERNSWTGVEALLRWNHPELGVVSPDKFIPLAEQTGLILPIGEWVLRESCRQLREWHCQGFHLPRISVNVSPLQLQRQDLLGIVKDAISSNNLCTQVLELEIVESALVEDSDRSVLILTGLREIGVKISIDDFGTGYSSLSYLRNLPIDILKIDRSFLLHAHESGEDERIFAAVIAMSLSLGLEVVTEGVECAEQEQLLKSYNCHEAQGFYFARPMPASELLQLFKDTQLRLEKIRLVSEGSEKAACCMLSCNPNLPCGEGPNLICRMSAERPALRNAA